MSVKYFEIIRKWKITIVKSEYRDEQFISLDVGVVLESTCVEKKRMFYNLAIGSSFLELIKL